MKKLKTLKLKDLKPVTKQDKSFSKLLDDATYFNCDLTNVTYEAWYDGLRKPRIEEEQWN